MEIIRKEEEMRKREEENHKAEIERRMKPRTFQDFEILYNELEVPKTLTSLIDSRHGV
jgi:hypothetical protein